MLECGVAYCRGGQLLCRSSCPYLQFGMIRSKESAQNEGSSTRRGSLIDARDLVDVEKVSAICRAESRLGPRPYCSVLANFDPLPLFFTYSPCLTILAEPYGDEITEQTLFNLLMKVKSIKGRHKRWVWSLSCHFFLVLCNFEMRCRLCLLKHWNTSQAQITGARGFSILK